VKSDVSFTQSRKVGDTDVKVVVSFVGALTPGANVTITLTETPFPYVGCSIDAIFDGELFSLINIEQTGNLRGPGYGDRFEQTCLKLFDDPGERRDLFNFIFREVRFYETEISDHNAGDFFQGVRFRLRLLEYAGTPVLLAHQLQ